MDTKIFEYLKNKRAVFEVRHYIIESQKQKIDRLRESHSRMAGEDLNERDLDLESQGTIEDGAVLDQCDYIVLGYVRVPLLQLWQPRLVKAEAVRKVDRAYPRPGTSSLPPVSVTASKTRRGNV